MEKVILHHDKMMLVLNNLLMVAEIKMNENLKARKSLNSWKLKLQHEKVSRDLEECKLNHIPGNI